MLEGVCPERPASCFELHCPSEVPKILGTNSLNVMCLNICPPGFYFLLFPPPFDSLLSRLCFTEHITLSSENVAMTHHGIDVPSGEQLLM